MVDNKIIKEGGLLPRIGCLLLGHNYIRKTYSHTEPGLEGGVIYNLIHMANCVRCGKKNPGPSKSKAQPLDGV